MTVATLQVKNWGEHQHYKDRKPPWIKLKTDVFSDYEFAMMQDASKLLLMCIWTLASRSEDGSVPYDFEFIKSFGQLKSVTQNNLKELIDKGFLIASIPIADCKQSASDSVSVSPSVSVSGKGGLGEKQNYEKEFEEFWKHFPKQRAGSKQKAWNAWQYAIKRKQALPSEIIAGCLAYAASEEVAKGMAKGCAAWLNDDRWTSDYRPTPVQKTNRKPDYFEEIMKSTVRGVTA